MHRVKTPYHRQAYEPLLRDEDDHDSEEEYPIENVETGSGPPFSWTVYFIFVLLGVAMLWAWNMFLAAAPYFQARFKENQWVLLHFQPAEVSVSTVTNLSSMLVLGSLQAKASYPKRITTSLVINLIAFTILALSTFVSASVPTYLGFLLVTVFVTAISAGMIQNGAFSFTAGFGKKEYTQAILVGNSIAGISPPIAQIIGAMVAPQKDGPSRPDKATPMSAFIPFITASVVSGITLVAFTYLLRRKSHYELWHAISYADVDEFEDSINPAENHVGHRSVSFIELFRKTPYMATAVFLCFAVTMIYPTFTTMIAPVNNYNPAVFIPVAFFMWNVGDLVGRLLTFVPSLRLTRYPFVLFCMALARLLFIPLYLACNIKGRGAVINSDVFYLVIVQFLFGLTNGYTGSNCMMGAADWVAPDEREAVGGFMATCLVAGLSVGSLLSFSLGNI